jgi:beta-lactamase regulating signal transducer with metallopeptidase domain
MLLNHLINALGWTLLHSFWQALLVFLVLRVLLAFIPHAPAHTRYALLTAGLTVTFAWFLFTFYHQWQHEQQRTITLLSAQAPSLAPAALPLLLPDHVSPDFFTTGNLFSWLDALYCTGLLVFAGKVIRDILAVLSIRNNRLQPFDPVWIKCLHKLSRTWNLNKKISLYLSHHIDVPVAIGYLKPAIYLPFSIVNLTPEQVEAILLHELAHIKRNDFLVNIIQIITETILFFNPCVWWMSKKIRSERENCCDDLVLSLATPRLYAEALLALEENRLHKSRFVLAARNKKQELFHRIKRIMEMKTKKLNVMQKLLVLVILTGSIFSIAWLSPESKTDHIPGPDSIQVNTPAHQAVVKHPDTIRVLTLSPRAITPPDPAFPDTIPGGNSQDTGRLTTLPLTLQHNMRDTILQNIRRNLQHIQVYNEDTLKKYQQKIQEYTSRMARYKSDAWKGYRDEMKAYVQKMQQYFNSTEWKDQQQELKKLSDYYKSDAWRHHIDSIRQAIWLLRPEIDSIATRARQQAISISRDQMEPIIAQAKKQSDLSRLNQQLAYLNSQKQLSGLSEAGNAAFILNGNGHAVNPDRIINMLLRDGLLKDDKNYKIRINDKGLYINGKKQSQPYFEKYHRMIGNHTNVEIKKKNKQTQTSVHTIKSDG